MHTSRFTDHVTCITASKYYQTNRDEKVNTVDRFLSERYYVSPYGMGRLSVFCLSVCLSSVVYDPEGWISRQYFWTIQ